jgi:heme-degrading monooxygenase HmoA
MYARSTTIQAQVSAIDMALPHMRDVVMPALRQMNGFIGLSMLVNRQSGRCVVTTAWQTEEAMHMSAQPVEPIRDRAAQILGGAPVVEEWEIAVMHRDHDSREGACVRSSWFRTAPDHIDQAVDNFRAMLPSIEALPGFCSASLMANRMTGRAVASVTYDNADSLRDSRDRAAMIRADVSREAAADILDVAEFELAIAHLRVPELA